MAAAHHHGESDTEVHKKRSTGHNSAIGDMTRQKH